MSMFKVGDQVKVNPSVLEDLEQRQVHLFEGALKHDVTGVVKLDNE